MKMDVAPRPIDIRRPGARGIVTHPNGSAKTVGQARRVGWRRRRAAGPAPACGFTAATISRIWAAHTAHECGYATHRIDINESGEEPVAKFRDDAMELTHTPGPGFAQYVSPESCPFTSGRHPMPNLSLTDLVDVVSRAGTPKATKVAEIKNRKAYQPATDFYKPFREGLVGVHEAGKDKKALGDLQKSLTDPKKIANYPDAIEGYRKWWGKKSFAWFEPPRNLYGHAGIDVAINPELGLWLTVGVTL